MLAPPRRSIEDLSLRYLINSVHESEHQLTEISAEKTRRQQMLQDCLSAIDARGRQLGMSHERVRDLIRVGSDDGIQQSLPFDVPISIHAVRETGSSPAAFARPFSPVNDSADMLEALRGYLRAKSELSRTRISF